VGGAGLAVDGFILVFILGEGCLYPAVGHGGSAGGFRHGRLRLLPSQTERRSGAQTDSRLSQAEIDSRRGRNPRERARRK